MMISGVSSATYSPYSGGYSAAYAAGSADGAPSLTQLEDIQKQNGKDASSRIPGREEDGSPKGECETCKNRKYQDGSNDPGVSYKTPTRIGADSAASAVRAHEMEHVFREQFKAQMEQRKVVSQSVALHTGICPECGSTYVSGGTTRTVTKGADSSGEDGQNAQELSKRFNVGMPDASQEGALRASA